MSTEVFGFGSSIVCLRFIAERSLADGQGFSHRSSEASRGATLTGSAPVCMIRRKTKASSPKPAALGRSLNGTSGRFLLMEKPVRAASGATRKRAK
jgi:hypothetical protein